MRTNIDLDDALIVEAMKLGGQPTKRAAVDSALRDYVRLQRQRAGRALFGKLRWDGDLDAMRRDD